MKLETFVGYVIGFFVGILLLFVHLKTHSVQMVSESVSFEILETKRGYSKIPDIKKDIYDNRDLDCMESKACLNLAEAIYFEGRGESLVGQIAIGWVVLNRVRSERFPNTIRGVLSLRCQFTYRCDGSTKKGYANKEAYNIAIFVAENILRGIFGDPTFGADHYLNPKAVKSMPRWTRVYPKVASIGNHDFYALE